MLKNSKLIFRNIVVFLLVFSLSNHEYNALVSISQAMAGVYVIYLMFVRKDATIKRIDKTLIYSYGLFFISLIISALIVNDMASLKKSFNYAYYSLPFWLLLYLCRFRFPEKTLRVSLMLSILLVGTYSLYDFVALPIGTRIGGLYDNVNGFATLLILNLPFIILFFIKSLEETKIRCINMLYCIICILGVGALILTGSRGGMLGFIVGIIFLYIVKYFKNVKYRKFFLFFLIIIITMFSSLFYGNNGLKRSYDMERLCLIKSSYNMWNDHKIAGVGLTNWKKYYDKYYILEQAKEPHLDMPHNTIAFFFSTTGIIGGLGFLVLDLGILRFLIFKMRRQSDNIYLQAMFWAFIALNVHGLVDAGITMKTAMRLFFALMGISVASVMYYDKKI